MQRAHPPSAEAPLRPGVRGLVQRRIIAPNAGLKPPINRFVEENNADPKPFVWTADPNRIIAAVQREAKVRVNQ
jgi:hypothetical protein